MKRHANSLVAGTAKRATRVALAALAGILVSTQARAQQIPPPPQALTTRVTFEGSGTEVLSPGALARCRARWTSSPTPTSSPTVGASPGRWWSPLSRRWTSG